MDETSLVVPITVVDVGRTFLLCDFRSDSSNVGDVPACELTSSTEVTLTSGQPEPARVVHVQVVQLGPGVVVHRGLHTFDGAQTVASVPIGPVDPAHSFALLSRRSDVSTTTLDSQFAIAARIADASTLELTRLAGGITLDVAWQVVQLPEARVSTGLTSVSDTASVSIATDLVARLDLARAFVVASSRAQSGDEAEYLVRAEIVDDMSIAFTRTGTGTTTEVAWSIVEDPRATAIRGVAVPGSLPTLTIPIPAVDPARTAVFLSFDGGRPSADGDLDDAVMTSMLEPTQLELRRSPAPLDVGGRVSWTLVQWAP